MAELIISIADTTVRRLFNDYVSKMGESLTYKAPRVMGIDEDHVGKIFRFVVTDLENKMLLDLLPDREPATLIEFFKRMVDRKNVEVVVMDMHRPYRSVIKSTFPSAKIIVDKFHVTQLADRKLDEIRRDIRRKMNDAEKQKFKYVTALLAMSKEKLSDESEEKLRDVFVQYPDIRAAYAIKEYLRRTYKARTRHRAGEMLYDIFRSVPDDIKPLVTLENTLKEWAEEIMNYFDHPFTNAYTEYANKVIKEINRASRSMSFEQLRYKVLFAARATKVDKFVAKKADYSPSLSFSNMITVPTFTDTKVLTRGFGVDMDVLLEELSKY